MRLRMTREEYEKYKSEGYYFYRAQAGSQTASAFDLQDFFLAHITPSKSKRDNEQEIDVDAFLSIVDLTINGVQRECLSIDFDSHNGEYVVSDLTISVAGRVKVSIGGMVTVEIVKRTTPHGVLASTVRATTTRTTAKGIIRRIKESPRQGAMICGALETSIEISDCNCFVEFHEASMPQTDSESVFK